MKKSKLIFIVLFILVMIFSLLYALIGNENLSRFVGNSSIISDLQYSKAPTVAEFKASYKKNNVEVDIPFLDVHFMDFLVGVGIMGIILLIILRKLTS